MTIIESKLTQLDTNPTPPDPSAHTPVTRSGNIMWMAGVGSAAPKKKKTSHRQARCRPHLEQGYEAAAAPP